MSALTHKASHLSQTAIGELKAFQQKMDQQVQHYFKQVLHDIDEQFTPYSRVAVDALADITVRGGKRLRGSFVYKTYQMYNDNKLDEVMKAAQAIEMFHAYLLIIDDICDLSDTRRGGPTAHRLVEHFHRRNNLKGDPEHFGEAVAMNAGLVGQHLASNIILSLDFPEDVRIRALKSINDGIYITAHGQFNDIFNEALPEVSEQNVINVLEWKTGVYTYLNPIQFGAILGGAPEDDFDLLAQYSIPGGIAFQIQDDIIGTFGNEETTGKSNMDDIKEGKVTLLVWKALQEANQQQRDILLTALGNHGLTREEHAEVQKIIVDTGALEYAQKKALTLVKQAKTSLDSNMQLYWKGSGISYLKGIADYMIEREL